MFCLWTTAATAGAFCLHCAQDFEPSGKAGARSPLNPLFSTPTNNSGGLSRVLLHEAECMAACERGRTLQVCYITLLIFFIL